MPLTVREVEAARPRPKPYGVADGDGLVLWVTPEGNKFWHFRYRLNGKQPRISLGRYPDVTLQKARQQATAYRTLVADGADPRAKRRIDRQRADTSDDGTFRAAAELWYKSKQDAGRSASTLDKIRTYLDKDILPELGSSKLVNITGTFSPESARNRRSSAKTPSTSCIRRLATRAAWSVTAHVIPRAPSFESTAGQRTTSKRS